jgi:ribosomal protein S27AE
MSLIKCHECQAEVSTEAKTCPKCGANVRAPKSGARWTWIRGGLILFGVFIAMGDNAQKEREAAEARRLAAMTPAQRAADAADKALLKEAQSAAYLCSDAVVKALHDPDSAEMDRPESYAVIPMKGHQFDVRVTGRAKNGFNAMRLLNVDCRVSHNGDNWTLIGLHE